LEIVVKLDSGAYQLPNSFVEYVESKLKRNGRGRPHLVQKLGSMDQVLDLLADAWIQRLNPRQLAKKYKVGYYQVYYFINETRLCKEELIPYLYNLIEKRLDNFKAYPLVKEWEAKIRRSGNLSALRHIPIMANVCGMRYHPQQEPYIKGFKYRPDKFDLETAQHFVDLYLIQNPHEEKLPYMVRMAIRHFLQVAHGINIPRGFGSQYGLSAENGHLGKYAHIKLSEEKLKEINRIVENDPYALDNGFDIGFKLGVQTCSRAFAIASIPLYTIPEEADPDMPSRLRFLN